MEVRWWADGRPGGGYLIKSSIVSGSSGLWRLKDMDCNRRLGVSGLVCGDKDGIDEGS